MKIAIVGGGIIGLTTALQLQNSKIRNNEVTVIAASFDELVSYVAAGFFRVGHSFCGPTEEITRKWVKDSYEYYDDIRKNNEPLQAGVKEHSVYTFADSSPQILQNHLMEAVVPIYRNLAKDEFNLIGEERKFGSYYKSLLIQCKYHIPWARNKLDANGTKFLIKKLTSLKELIDDYDFIFNCTGLGAGELCNDRNVVPIRGQVIKVFAPWIESTFYDELDTYIIPGVDGTCTLGGTRNFESTRMHVCPYDAQSIRERCESILPSLKAAKTLEHVVGLRPHREGSVRVEIERLSNGGRHRAIVIHNYGHGGYGVTTAPGTSKYAVELAENYHKASGSKL